MSSYHNNGDINGNGYYLTTNYDPNANMAADLDNNPEKRCKYNFCGDSLAYNYMQQDLMVLSGYQIMIPMYSNYVSMKGVVILNLQILET